MGSAIYEEMMAAFETRMARADHAYALYKRITRRLEQGAYWQRPASRRFWQPIAARLWKAGLLLEGDEHE